MASINASTSGAGGVITTADNTGILNIQTAGTNAVTVDASQNVGIGTTSPSTYSAKFAIKTSDQDVIGFVGGTTYGMRFGTNSNFAVIDGVDAATGTSAYNPLCMRGSQLLFNTAGTERMRIDSSGSLLINTPSNIALSSRTVPLQILQNNNLREAITIKANSSTYDISSINFVNAVGSQVGYIFFNASSVTYSTSSDYRLKENIVPMTGALDKVAQLKPVTYTWKQDGSDGQGFIAHELQAVVPDAVTGEKDAVDDEGNPVYQGIDTSFLVATLTAAIQEQQTIINDLKARIETLEAK
jgi:hypothetical protein